jgi:hypothetical protein
MESAKEAVAKAPALTAPKSNNLIFILVSQLLMPYKLTSIF